MITELEGRILHTLDRLHEQFPLMSTHDRQRVQSQLDYVGDDALVHATVDRLIARKQLVGDLRRIGRAGFKPPEPASFANQAGGNAANLKDLFDVCVAEGHLAQVADDLYLHADAEAEMRRLVGERLARGGG